MPMTSYDIDARRIAGPTPDKNPIYHARVSIPGAHDWMTVKDKDGEPSLFYSIWRAEAAAGRHLVYLLNLNRMARVGGGGR